MASSAVRAQAPKVSTVGARERKNHQCAVRVVKIPEQAQHGCGEDGRGYGVYALAQKAEVAAHRVRTMGIKMVQRKAPGSRHEEGAT